MTVEVAEGWAKEADARVSSDQPSHMVAASFYEKAIQTYHTIPRLERTTYSVNERIAELRRSLNESGERSLDEMGVISTPGQDISRIVKNARDAVRGKVLDEALKAFANLSHTNARELRESATELLHDFPLQALIPETAMSRDGRVIAKRPGMSLSTTLSGDADADGDGEIIYSKMIENYRIHVDRIHSLLECFVQ